MKSQTGKETTLDFENLSEEQSNLKSEGYKSTRSDFVTITDKLMEELEDDSTFLYNKVSSRNTFQTIVFEELQNVLLFSKLLKKHQLKHVKCNSIGLYECISKHVKKNRLTIHVSFKTNIFSARNALLKENLKIIIFNIIMLFKRKLLSIATKNQVNLRQPFILVDSFITPDSLKNGKFRDLYYSFLDKPIRSDYPVLIIPTLAYAARMGTFFKYFTKQPEGQPKFILKESLLPWSRIAFIVARQIVNYFFSKKAFSVDFHGIEIKPLLQREYKTRLFDIMSIESQLNYECVKELKSKNAEVRLFLNWHENQIVDRAFFRAFSRYYPEVVTRGYQGFIDSRDAGVHLNPSKIDRNLDLLPTELVVIGKNQVKEIKEFDRSLNIILGPAYRYSRVFKASTRNKRENILILCPIEPDKTTILINMIRQIMPRFPSYNFLFKAHPSIEILIKDEPYYNHVNFISGDLYDIFPRTAITIGIATGALFESVLSGIPTIIVSLNKHCINNPIPTSLGKYQHNAHNKEDIAEGILKLEKLTDFAIQKSDYLEDPDKYPNYYLLNPNPINDDYQETR